MDSRALGTHGWSLYPDGQTIHTHGWTLRPCAPRGRLPGWLPRTGLRQLHPPFQVAILSSGNKTMGSLDEFTLPARLFLKAYRWRRIDPVPWMPLRKPLAESRLALVSTAGFVLPGQEPFKVTLAGGDG